VFRRARLLVVSSFQSSCALDRSFVRVLRHRVSRRRSQKLARRSEEQSAHSRSIPEIPQADQTLCPSTRYTRRRTTLPWGSFPYDVSNADSDEHRVYHTRLSYAFRFSQPPGVLIPPAFLRPCFMPNPSLGLWLSEVSLSQKPLRLSPRAAPRARGRVQARD
jgi:hypothetical protein